jgi:phage gp46-like protein
MTVQEIALKWDEQYLEANLDFEDGDLSIEQGVMSAIIISLFTDRRADQDDDLPDLLNPDLRGWWGDKASPEIENDQIGSRLWLLERSKATPEVLIQAKGYIKECLNWLIEDGIMSDIQIETEKKFIDETYILAFKAIFSWNKKVVEGSDLVMTMSFSTGSSGVDPRTIPILVFNGLDSLTFDGIDELIF